MTESSAQGLRHVGGSPAYVAAHGIKDHTDLSFDHAFVLAKLVLEEGGGPVSCRGKGSTIKKPAETALVQQGLIEVSGSSEFTQRVYIELNVDGRIAELLDAKYSGVKITPISATQRLKWAATATKDAFDLVSKYLSA